ncbi:MAG: glycosyltransferase family 4 protein [Ornithinimicrobium sp.]
MGSATALRSVVRVVRNLLLAGSMGRQHLRHTGAKAISVTLRRSPPWVRGAAARQRVRADVAGLARAADSDFSGARQILSHAAGHLPASGRAAEVQRARLVSAAIVLHDTTLAAELWPSATSTDIRASSRQRRLLALLYMERGDIGAAIEQVRAGTDSSSRALLARVSGEAEVLQAQLLRQELKNRTTVRITAGTISTVLHVVSAALPDQQTGYTIRTQGIASAQREAGIDAQVVSRLGFPVDIGVIGAASRCVFDAVPYHHMLPSWRMPPIGPRRQIVAAEQLARHVEREAPQVLHAHSKHENGQIALMVGHRLGLPVVYEARGFLEETWRHAGGSETSDFYRWTRDAETLCMMQSDAVTTLSTAMAADIVARGVDSAKVSVMPNAVSQNFCAHIDDGEKAAARGGLGIPDEAIVFGTVTTLNDYEGLDTVIAAMRHLRDPRMILLVVGSGQAKAALQRAASPLGDRVRFTGRVQHENVRDYLAAMDIFVVPRKATPVTCLVPPIKPLEAMGLGIPVLASDLPPLVEIVQPGAFGAIATAEDKISWAEQMTTLGYAPQDVHELGARAARFVRRQRTWKATVAKYTAIYESVAHC